MNLEEVDTRLSYSSSLLLKGCEQKYWHYKVNKTPIDSDASRDTKAFAIGKSFHKILEDNMHKKPAKIVNELELCTQTEGLDEKDIPLVHAMIIKYLRLHKRVGLEAIGCEYQIEDKTINGFIDVVLADKYGNWWICDLKTAKSFWKTTVARLPMDRQLNLYAGYKSQIAKKYKLKLKDFQGCRYRVTTKSTAKQRVGESYSEYVMRMADSYIKSIDVVVPASKLNISETKYEIQDLHSLSLELRSGDITPKKNLGYCESYFKPCEYWSQCHGKNFTDMSEDLEVIVED